jgi:hypothetical protein
MIKSILVCTIAAGAACFSPVFAKSEWQVLFDGESTEAWRGFRQESFPAGAWEVREGVLTSIGSGDRTDIITRDRYTDFELELEWRVEPRGNSGVFYRVSEEPRTIWHHAPEIQILDDVTRNVPSDHVQATGSLYDLLGANDRKTLKPVGEFNSMRIVVRGDKVEHWLNGAKILSYDLSSEKVKQLIAASKFAAHAGFAKTENGHIGLQHHGDTVGFRNIRIRRLADADNR